MWLQDYQVDLYLRQHWFDPRLNHSEIKQVAYTFHKNIDQDAGLLHPRLFCNISKKKTLMGHVSRKIFNSVSILGSRPQRSKIGSSHLETRGWSFVDFFINNNNSETIHFTNCANCGNKVLGKV